MNTIDVEKLNQLISRTDISGNDKVRWLTDFIDGREFEQQEKSYSEEDDRNVLKAFIVLLLFIGFNLFAQGNSDLENWENGNNENAGGNGNGNAPNEMPIDKIIVLLFVSGVSFLIGKQSFKNES